VTAAGGSIATEINKCRLKPLRREDYYPVTFTDDEWAALARAFPTGVCDWGRRGVDQQDNIPWMSYQDGRGRVVYGGRRMGDAPAGSGAGWTSRAFGWWRTARR
jgi:hypothetical protein